MNALIKPLGFCVVLILAFGAFTYILPQVKGEAPEEEEVLVGTLTMDSFVAMGEKVYNGKGTCTLCHNKLGRAPDLLTYNVVKVSQERMANAQYQGKATDAEGYIRESMLEPSAYVVKGFGKKGSNDTESPMPAVDQAPIQLSELAIGAVIAYLQQKDGNPITVALPTAAPESDKMDETVDASPAPPESPEEVIAKYGCAACHSILETQSVIGPNLNGVGKRLNINEIRTSIIDPKAVIADGFPPIMPNFPAMTVAELEMVAQFLVKQIEAQP
jgi:mono/diheme cytochrome c family protein